MKTKKEEPTIGIGDDDDDSDSAANRLLEEMDSDKEEEAKVKPVNPDEEEEEEDEEGEGQQQRAPRQERRRNRYTEQKTAREDAERRAAAAEQQSAFLQQQIQQTNVLQQIAKSIPRRDEKDPLDEQIADVRQRRAQLREVYEIKKSANALTQAEFEQMVQKDNGFADEEMRISFERHAQRRGLTQTPQQTQAESLHQFLAMQYPDVFRDGKIRDYMIRHYNNLTATGSPDGMGTLAQAVEATRKAFRLQTPAGAPRQAAPVTNHSRRVLSGSPSGSGGGGNGGGTRTVQPTKAHMAMAKAMYPHLYKKAPQLAFSTWVRKGGGAPLEKDD
jgi:hypothetical protein